MTSGRAAERQVLKRIRDLEKRLDAISRTPQLTHSAVDDGAVVVTVDGATTGIIGKQYDGTTAAAVVNGPTPPIPSTPVVETVVGGLRVQVLGTFVDPQPGFTSPVVAPMDFARWDLEVSTDPSFPEFVPATAPSAGSILSPSGGQIKVGWPAAGVPLYVRVRTRTTSGKRSDPSLTVGPINSGQVGLGDLGFDLSTYVASNSIQYGTVLPTVAGFTGRIGTLFLLETSAGPPPQYTAYRYTGAAWVALADQSATNALASAVAAQQAADTKAKVFNQTTAPTYSGAANTAVWFDSDDDNRPWRWSGSAWTSMRLGNGAIEPNSLVASNVIATGTISAALLQTILVLTTAVIAGDPAATHSRLDDEGLRAFITDEGLPTVVGYYGQGFGVINPDTGQEVGGINDGGDVTGQSLSIVDPNPTFGGQTLYEMFGVFSKGVVAYGQAPSLGGVSASTNTEAAFLELGFTAEAGRVYAIFIEGFEPLNVTSAGGWWLRMRGTTASVPTAAATPTTASTAIRSWHPDEATNGAWNVMIPQFALYNGPAVGAADSNVRLLFTYGAGTGTAPSQGAVIRRDIAIYAFVVDLGLRVPETGNDFNVAGTSGGTTTKTNKTFESVASWVRTWNQSGSVIADDELQQGYGDSFNGIRRSAAGWTNIPSMTGASVTEVAVYMESYYWWNMSGGTLNMGYHNTSAEPAAYPGATGGVLQKAFTARSQGKWIVCPVQWNNALELNGLKGLAMNGPSTSATYYGKFRGPAYARPKLRIRYTI